MKNLLLAATIILIYSCQGTTEDKIKSAIIDIEKKDLQTAEKIEEISIDSLSYESVSEMDYWIEASTRYNRFLAENTKLFIDLALSYGANKDTIKLEKLHADRKKQEAEAKKLDSLYEHADTTALYYRVKYILKVKSNKNSINERQTTYLNQRDLKRSTFQEKFKD